MSTQKFEPGCIDPGGSGGSTTENQQLLGITGGFRPEPPHVAQQSRRDKLRVQQLYDYDPSLFSSSTMLDFAAAATPHESSVNFANNNPSSFHDASGLWKSLASSQQQQQDWIQIQNPFYHNQHHHLKPSDGDISSAAVYQGNQHHLSHQAAAAQSLNFCNNALQDVVTCSSSSANNNIRNQASMENMASLVQQNMRDTHHQWVDGGNELLLLPSNYNNKNQAATGHSHRLDTAAPAATQALSLSLASSYPLPELHVAQFEERFGREDFAARNIHSLQNTRSAASEVSIAAAAGAYPPKFAVSNRVYTSPALVSSNDGRRGTGPLGPFTGYATILKSSKFLRPAQQLLDEFCNMVTGSKPAKQSEAVQERSSGVVTAACDVPAVGENCLTVRAGNSGASSSFYGSTAMVAGGGSNDHCGAGSSSGCQTHRPEFQQKAKLLYMQEEVCRRYKQYHQQMQMVVSSFESVAGLSAATPYTLFALKAISKHFRSLKNAISDQLHHISKILGEELMSSPGSSDTSLTPRLKFIEQNLRKHKSGDGSSGLMDHAQPVWRPQRGLPERSVAVLRAWLFEHFLHPYPTDTDKHMLASQTGLSRNQVSNWFINARVRLWKPMVEEIHMLETKGLNEMDLNSSKKNDNRPELAPHVDSGRPQSDQRSEGQCSKPSECSSMGSVPNEDVYRTAAADQWHREKRTRMECMIPGGADSSGGLMSFATTYQGGMDLAGLGAVSLTLGLTHSVHHQQQQQQQIRRHFGGEILRDFVG